jgi:hypothetical protein
MYSIMTMLINTGKTLTRSGLHEVGGCIPKVRFTVQTPGLQLVTLKSVLGYS